MSLKTLIVFLFLCSPAYAEQWICFDVNTKVFQRKVQGDGTVLKIAEANNENIRPDCILAVPEEWNAAGKYTKVDVLLKTGERIVPFTKQEIDDAVAAEELLAKQARDAQVASIDDAIIATKTQDANFIKTDAEIDGLSTIDDIKAYLKKMMRVIKK